MINEYSEHFYEVTFDGEEITDNADIPENVAINGKLYPLNDILDLELYAKKNLGAYKGTDKTSGLYGAFVKGSYIGKIYSWVINKSDGSFWFMFYDSKNQPFFVKNESGAFNIDFLLQQGVKDTATKKKEEEEANKSIWEKLGEDISGISNALKIGIIVVIVAIVFFELNKRYKFIKF